MNRRQFLAGLIAARSLECPQAAAVAARGPALPIHLTVDLARPLGVIAPDFLGFGYETASVATPGLLSAKNRGYVQFVRTLGKHGVIRVGGNVSDYSTYSARGRAIAAPQPQSTVINAAVIEDLGEFLEATGWKLIWGLNLGSGTPREAVEEAQAVAAAAKGKLLALEIGNEPDLYAGPHRPQGYGYEQFLDEYRQYKAAIRAKLPEAPFAGPDVAIKTDWVTRFARDEGNDIKLLTHHYYAEGPPKNPASTIANLLRGSASLDRMLAQCRAASQFAGVPFRICETNSCFGGGKPGVSDAFASALWGLDFLFTLASAGASGANLETGVNQHGFISSYSPIGDDEHRGYSAQPLYYGMLAFAQASRGRMLNVRLEASGVNVRAYAVLGDDRRLWVTLINKERGQSADVHVLGVQRFTEARILRLAAPSLESTRGVTLGGSEVTAEGEWTPGAGQKVAIRDGACVIPLPAASAVVTTFTGERHG